MYFYFSLNLSVSREVQQKTVTTRFIKQLLSKNKKKF